MTEEESGSLVRWEAQMRKGSLELAVLGALWNEARYGLEILRSLGREGLEVSEGTLYPLLDRLRRDRLVVTDWIDGDLGHPRKYYELTQRGRELARAMTSRWHAFNRSLRSLLVPLMEEDVDDRFTP